MKVKRLLCGVCGNPLHGLGTDVVFICTNCGSGWTGEGEGLSPLKVEHRAHYGQGLSLPFWRVKAAVHVLKRTVRNEFTTTILSFSSRFDQSTLPGKTRETGGISEKREFLFPAFPVNGLPGLGVSLSENLSQIPDLIDEGSRYPAVCGCSISSTDAQVLTRCVAVGQETEKSDWLAEIELVISNVSSSVVILPCSVEVEKVKIAETGVSFFRRSVPEWDRIKAFSVGEA